MKFFHISDIHFGKTYKNRLVENSKILIKAQRRAFEKMVRIAIAYQVEGVLIAGDLFHTNEVSIHDERFIINAFSELNDAGIKVFYCSGNHDYTDSDSKVRQIKYPQNVHTFFNDVAQVFEDDKGYRVVSCGHNNKHEMRDLISSFPCFSDGVVTIGLGHSMVSSSSLTDGSEGDYMATSVEALKATSYDYWALGHIHKAGQIDPFLPCYYSGSLSGISSKEIGPKGGYLVEFVDGRVQDVEFVQCSEVTWIRAEIEVDRSIREIDKLYDQLLKTIKKETRGINANQSIFIIVTMKGTSCLAVALENEKLRSEIESHLSEESGCLSVELRHAMKQVVDKEKIFQDEGLVKEIAQNFKDKEKRDLLLEVLMEETLFDIENTKDKRDYIENILEENYERIVSYLLGEDHGNK